MKHKAVFTYLAVIILLVNLHADWITQFTGSQNLNDITFPINTNTGFTCGDNSYYLKTTDGGTTWDSLLIIPSGNFYGIDFPVDELTGYIACDQGNVLKTTDGGEVWDIINTGTEANLHALHFPNNTDTGYVVGQQGTVKATRDGGLTWEDLPAPVEVTIEAVFFLNGENGWMVGEEGKIFYTPNGMEWMEQPAPAEVHLYDVFFVNSMNGWVVGANNTLLKTTNGGEIWDEAVSPFEEEVSIRSVIFPIDSSTGFIAGSIGNIARTTDAGNSWVVTRIADPITINSLVFPIDNEIGWACGNQGMIFKTTDGGIWVEETNRTQQSATNLLSCTPNPFHTNLTINAPNLKNGQANLRIFDCTGSIVRTLVLDKKGIVNWNGRNELNQRVPPGVYLLELKNRNNSSYHLKVTVLE